MAKNALKPVPSGINLGDIVYVLFKHKWKILLVSLLAAGGASAYYLKAGVPYESEAKLMVRYVVERSSFDRIDSTSGTSSAREMDSIIQAELAILTSWDLAEKVAAKLAAETDSSAATAGAPTDASANEVSPEEVSPKEASPKEDTSGKISYSQLIGPGFDGPPTKAAAASVILQNLTVNAERGSSVLTISFRHNDPALPRKVLDTFVSLYFTKHLEIHRSRDTKEMADRAKEKTTNELNQASDALKDLLNKHGIISLAEGSQRINAEVTAAQAELNAAEAALEEQTARVKEFDRLLASEVAAPEASADTPNPAPAAPVASAPPTDSSALDSYRVISSRLAQARGSHDMLLLKFKPDHPQVRSLQSQIDGLMSQRLEMEKKHPDLILTAPLTASATPVAAAPRVDLPTQRAEFFGLQARVGQLRKNLESAKSKATALAKDAPLITTAQRTLEMQEESYKYFLTSWKKADADTLLKAENIPNISTVQAPTPALMNIKRRNQIILGMLFGGPLLGVGAVLLFGLLLNRNIKRPLELEDGMNLPLMLSIPYFSRRNRLQARRPMGAARTTKLLEESESGKAPWDQYHFIHPFAEALRDRLTSNFEATGNVRKPKLIAVTGYSHGAGTSTLAGGLAASLSEIGEGKVLLVDMSGNKGAAHPFFDGRPAVSLTKALRTPSNGTLPTSESGGNENLFLARADAPSAGAATVGLRRMMPELKASDFDYVIFDMPPLGQTKPTATTAGFMDKVLVIVEAEANSRSDVRRGYKDLLDAGADVSMIFNKARSHGPKALVGSIA